MHKESRCGSQFLSDSFRGKPAAEKRLNELKVNAIGTRSPQENMRKARPCVQVSAERVDTELRSFLSVAKEPGSGRPSGNGGQMNAAKPKLVAISKKKKTGVAKPKRKRGAEKMREAADKIVGRDCKPIIEALSTNGKKGQTLSAKFLYSLAKSAEEAGEGESAQKFRSMATELANSPQWTGDWPKEKPNEDDEIASDS